MFAIWSSKKESIEYWMDESLPWMFLTDLLGLSWCRMVPSCESRTATTIFIAAYLLAFRSLANQQTVEKAPNPGLRTMSTDHVANLQWRWGGIL